MYLINSNVLLIIMLYQCITTICNSEIGKSILWKPNGPLVITSQSKSMFSTLSSICKRKLTSINTCPPIYMSYTKKEMSTLSDAINGLNDVKCKIDAAVQKRDSTQTHHHVYPTLVAVSKTKPVEQIICIYEQGQRHFGENYVQELLTKSFDAEILEKCPEIKWHFIGHLQRNKVSKVLTIPGLYVIETIDSEKLAKAVNNGWEKHNNDTKLKIMVQVNTSNEKEKSGISTDKVVDLYKYIIEHCPNLELIGLMTIGQYGYDCSHGPNPDFLVLVDCRKKVCDELKLNSSDVELSMGMSSDFEHAIELGSTSVRVGSSIFGYRPRKE